MSTVSSLLSSTFKLVTLGVVISGSIMTGSILAWGDADSIAAQAATVNLSTMAKQPVALDSEKAEKFVKYSWEVDNDPNHPITYTPYRTYTETTNWEEYSFVQEYIYPMTMNVSLPESISFPWEEELTPIGVQLVRMQNMQTCFDTVADQYQGPGGLHVVRSRQELTIGDSRVVMLDDYIESDHGGTIEFNSYCKELDGGWAAVIRIRDNYNLTDAQQQRVVGSITMAENAN